MTTKKKGAATPAPLPIQRWELFVLAGAAKVDPRAVKRYLQGEPQKSASTTDLIERVLREHGYGHLVRQPQAAQSEAV